MEGLAFGNLRTGTVRDALMRVRDLIGDASVAVIRSLDSAHSGHDLSHALSFHKVPHDVSLGNVHVSMDHLWSALDAEVFTGFDEVWIYPGKLPDVDLGSVPSATSDGIDFTHGVPKGLAEAIERTRCVLVLGDGCGLNYATSDERIDERITRACG